MYDIEALYEAASVREAVALLGEHKGAKIIAGGSDILIKIREGKLSGCTLVSIHGLDELRGAAMDDDGTIRIGALTSFSHVERDPILQRNIPMLCGAAGQVGGPQIRNIGTIGGNICNGVTSADTASTLMALEAELLIEGPRGMRLARIEDHYISSGNVDLRPDEVLTQILIRPENYRGWQGRYIKYSMRRAMDIATLGCAAMVRLRDNGSIIERARLAFGVAGPVPMRCKEAERAIEGMEAGEAALSILAERAKSEINPRTSWRASREFRLHLAGELTRRAMAKAIRLAGGNIDG